MGGADNILETSISSSNDEDWLKNMKMKSSSWQKIKVTLSLCSLVSYMMVSYIITMIFYSHSTSEFTKHFYNLLYLNKVAQQTWKANILICIYTYGHQSSGYHQRYFPVLTFLGFSAINEVYSWQLPTTLLSISLTSSLHLHHWVSIFYSTSSECCSCIVVITSNTFLRAPHSSSYRYS